MTPAHPQQRHINAFLSSQETEAETNPINGVSPKNFGVMMYGSLIPPGSGIARVAMGNSSSYNDIGNRTTSQPMNASIQHPQAKKQRSQLSALLDQHAQQQQQQQRTELDSSRDTSTFNKAGIPALERPKLYQRTNTPPTSIPSNMASSGLNAQINDRRCLSSKELGTLAPPSGSPYAFMLQQKEMIEFRMTERLKQTRELGFGLQEASPLIIPDDSSMSSRNTCSRLANEARNRRRAEHNRAVTNDLCEIVADLFIAESKLLNPMQYGVGSSVQREQVLRAVERFVGSLPARYALGAETASEVLLHMRLMSAIRTDPNRATVHIMSLENNEKWANLSSDQRRSRKLVTIACIDTTGLLEYVTRLLATGGSRVLDADVMLSNDNIALVSALLDLNFECLLSLLLIGFSNFANILSEITGSVCCRDARKVAAR